MKHSSFVTSVLDASSNWEGSSAGLPEIPEPSPQACMEALDDEGIAAFTSIHKKARAMDEANLMRLFFGENLP